MKYIYTLIFVAIVATMSSMSTVEKAVVKKNINCGDWSPPDANGNQYKVCCTSTGAGSACTTYTRNCGYCGPQ